MRLPDLTFNLPDWNDSDFTQIKVAEQKVRHIGRKAGTNSDNFQKACLKLINIAIHGSADKFVEHINSSVDVRAFTFLLGASEDFVNHVSLTSAHLDSLVIPRDPMSKLSLIQLIRAYFVRYDTVASAEVLAAWRSFIMLQLNQLPLSASTSDLASYIKHASVLFSAAGPSEVVAFAKRIGHIALEIIIDRSAGAAISTAWQSAILTIAGDPRVPTSNPNYQKWWVLLGEQRIGLMRGWLSRFDLALFLKVLEQSARDGSNADMERMFGSRKRFMEGLLEQGVVSQSRLFLSMNAERYLKRYYKQDQLPEYARVDSKDTSMIYLNLSGKAHMVEGSHSFKLKLFDQLPTKSKLVDYSVTKFSDFALRTGVVGQYYQEFESVGGLRDLTHDVHLNWQYNAIRFLAEQGISVSVHELIGAARYREYKSKFGVY